MLNFKGNRNPLKILVINLRGSLDSESSDEFYEYVSSKLAEGYKKFIINCEGLLAVSSAGVSTIIKLKKKIAYNDSYIVYAKLNSEIRALLKVFGIDKNIIIAKDREDAKNILNDSEYLKTENTLRNLNSYQNQYISVHKQQEQMTEKTEDHEDQEQEAIFSESEEEENASFSESELEDMIDEYYAYSDEDEEIDEDVQDLEDIPESVIQAEPISMVEKLDDTDEEIEALEKKRQEDLDILGGGLVFTPDEIDEKTDNSIESLEETKTRNINFDEPLSKSQEVPVSLEDNNSDELSHGKINELMGNDEFLPDELDDLIDEYYAFGIEEDEDNFWETEQDVLEEESEEGSPDETPNPEFVEQNKLFENSEERGDDFEEEEIFENTESEDPETETAQNIQSSSKIDELSKTDPQYKLDDILNNYYAFVEESDETQEQTNQTPENDNEDREEDNFVIQQETSKIEEDDDSEEENFRKTHQFYDIDGKLNISETDTEDETNFDIEKLDKGDFIEDEHIVVDIDNLEVESMTDAEIQNSNLMFSNDFYEYEKSAKLNNKEEQNPENFDEIDAYNDNDLDVQALLMKPIVDGDTHQYENLNQKPIQNENTDSSEEEVSPSLEKENEQNQNLNETPYDQMYSANQNEEPETSQFKIITVHEESSKEELSILGNQNYEENILDAIYEPSNSNDPGDKVQAFDNMMDEIITECFSCGTKLKVKKPGNHKCPACSHTFKMTQSGTTYNL